MFDVRGETREAKREAVRWFYPAGGQAAAASFPTARQGQDTPPWEEGLTVRLAER